MLIWQQREQWQWNHKAGQAPDRLFLGDLTPTVRRQRSLSPTTMKRCYYRVLHVTLIESYCRAISLDNVTDRDATV